MQRKLKEISHILPGYTFRGAIVPDNNGGAYVLQAKNIGRNFLDIDVDKLTQITFDASGYDGYVKTNDILLVSRGMKSGTFRSAIFKSNNSKVVASSSVHIIRITSSNVLPEYLSYYLNSKKGQDQLIQIVSGSYIGALSRRKLEEIKIPIPNINKQTIFVKLYQNTQQQLKIHERKKIIIQNIIYGAFNNLNTK